MTAAKGWAKRGVGTPPWAMRDELLLSYFRQEWGAPVLGERELFEALSLECFQAGLSWLTILAKRPAFRLAFARFDPERVAQFGEAEVAELMADEAIIRNERKIRAVIHNAKATIELRGHGGLPALVWSFAEAPQEEDSAHSSPGAALAARLKEHGFKFVGPTIARTFLEATGVIRPEELPSSS